MAKPTKTLLIISREHADQVLGEYVSALLEQERLQNSLDTQIAALHSELGPQIERAKVLCAAKEEALEAWAEQSPTEFGQTKSLQLTNGRIGFRFGPPTLKPLSKTFTWERILCLVRARLPGCIRIKEEVDKEQLLAANKPPGTGLPPLLDDLALKALGLKVIQAEKFFLEARR